MAASKINTFETNPQSPRYGRPLTYNITITTSTGMGQSIEVHYTRIIHIVDDPLESDMEGAPRLEKIFNRLMDLEKIVGGSAEMFWRNARPGYQGEVNEKYNMSTDVKKDMQNQLDEYEHNLRRFLILEGVKVSALQQNVADPKSNVDVQIQMISAATSIPKRILTGSERGELSSGQDSDEVNDYIQTRRDNHAEPHIVRPFVDRCIQLGILPKPKTGKYTVMWSDLFSKSEAQKVKIGLDRSTAIKNYVGTPMAEAVLPPSAFMEFCLGLDTDQIDLINEMVKDQVAEESQFMQDNPTSIETENIIPQ